MNVSFLKRTHLNHSSSFLLSLTLTAEYHFSYPFCLCHHPGYLLWSNSRLPTVSVNPTKSIFFGFLVVLDFYLSDPRLILILKGNFPGT